MDTKFEKALWIGFERSYNRFILDLINLSIRNVKKVSFNTVSIYTEIDCNTFVSLSEVIYWAVTYYHYKKANVGRLCVEEKNFMSGIKHVNNLEKHEFKMAIIFDPRPKLEWDNVKRLRDFHKIDLRAKLICRWSDISPIPCDNNFKFQRDNYNTYIKGKEIKQTVLEMRSIISKLK